MTTKELEKKLKISENTCIHCPTLELAKQVLDIFHKLGLKWSSRKYYIIHTNWDSHKENTVYCPFYGTFAFLRYAQRKGYEIISAEKFIALHTEDEEFDLENYEPKGQLIGFPKEIIARMLECQEEQGNKRDISVFEKCIFAGFTWEETKEGAFFWHRVIVEENFDIFFEKYPKKEEVKTCSKCHKEKPLSEFHKRGDRVRPECKECRKQEYQELKNNKNMQENNKKEEDSQEFRVGDKVFYYTTNEIGIIKEIHKYKCDDIIDIIVDFGNDDVAGFQIDSNIKRPYLLHYRDDYNYDVIDFNNLPKRQEQKMWRAKEGGVYHFVNFLTKGWFFSDESSDDYDYPIDNNNYNSGNYFRTEVEAEIIAQKLNTYFKQLIKEEHDNKRIRKKIKD